MKRVKHFLQLSVPVLVVALFGHASLRAQQLDSAQVPVDSIQAVVNDTPITYQQILMLMEPQAKMLYQRLGNNPMAYSLEQSKLQQDTTDTLVKRQVILHEFSTTSKLPESIIEEEVEDRIKERNPDRIQLVRQLQAEGSTLEELRQKIRDQFIVEIMRYTFVKQPIISPLKIENYYSTHTTDFKQDDQVKLRMIVINKSEGEAPEVTRKRAEEILSQIKGGASFAEMARIYSDGSQKKDGGETGWEDFEGLTKELGDAVNKLKPGQFSDVIELPKSFFLILLEDRHPTHVKPLSEVRGQIEKTLSTAELKRMDQQWISRLEKKTYIRYF